MATLSLEDLQKFSYKLAVPALVTLLVDIIGFTTFGLIICVIIHIIVLGLFFLLFKEFKSAFLKLVLAGLVCCLLGEILMFFNLDLTKYDSVYWSFLAVHFARNALLTAAFVWNILKGHLFNQLWIKLLPYIIVIPIFFILQLFIFSQEGSYTIVFVLYNVSLCLMLLTSGLRYSHTSDKSFVIMIVVTVCFVLSEIFYFLQFASDDVPTSRAAELLAENNSIVAAFRAPFLQLGSCLMMSATADHVNHFKMTVKQRVYLPLTEKETSALRGRGGQTAMKNLKKKPMEEPLI